MSVESLKGRAWECGPLGGPGMFHVAGRVSASDVLPFYGEETYEASARYSIRFYPRRPRNVTFHKAYD
jgi:hypothetical protein